MNDSRDKSTPMVSIIVPTLNAAQYVGDALDSAIKQSHSNLETVVVDDNSSDGTQEIVKSVGDPRIRLLTGPNRGLAGARNFGVRRSRGDLIAFLDADNYWYTTKLEKQIKLLQLRPDVCMVGCYMDLVDKDGRIVGKTGQPITDEDLPLIAGAQLLPFATPSILFRRKSLEDKDAFDESLTTNVAGAVDDLELISKMASTEPVACIPEILGAFRLHDESITANNFYRQRLGTRFVQERRKAEASGNDLTWDEFAADENALRIQRSDRAAAAYYAAGMHVVHRRWVQAAAAAGKSFLLAPTYTMKRVKVNKPWATKRT